MLSGIAATRSEGEVQSAVRADEVVSVAELVSAEAVDTAGIPVADVLARPVAAAVPQQGAVRVVGAETETG